jgi:hypothetical protein
MQVPDEIRKCAAFVAYRTADGEFHERGTAFFITRSIKGVEKAWVYAVTAKHVIDKIKEKGLDKVYLRMNLADGEYGWMETDLDQWRFHPTDASVDVAVHYVYLSEKVNGVAINHVAYPIEGFATDNVISKQNIGIGDEVFITGLFHHRKGDRINIPIVRVGNIAAMPEEPIQTDFGATESTPGTMDAYLIEARSMGGLSGSPVYVHLGFVRNLQGATNILSKGVTFYLLGLMHGHWDTKAQIDEVTEDSLQLKKVNMGIAIVVPAPKILEVINQPSMRMEEQRVEQELRSKHLPTLDSVDSDVEEAPTREDFFNMLRKVSRPDQPPPDEETSETSE